MYLTKLNKHFFSFKSTLPLIIKSFHYSAIKFKNNSTLATYSKFEYLKVSEVSPHVLEIELNRPKINAINRLMFKEIKDCFKLLNYDKYFRCSILSSSQSLFCAGIDVFTLQENLPNENIDFARRALQTRHTIVEFQNSFKSVLNCSKPIIGVIHGACIGAGVDLISLIDIRYCSKDAYFESKEVQIGLAADLGTLQFLPLIVGNQSWVREFVFTGRKVFSQEASEVGFVGKVCSDLASTKAEALELAKTIASKTPVAVQGSKLSLNYSRDHGPLLGLEFMTNWNMSMLQTEDISKSAKSIMSKAKEPPTYDDF